MHPSRVALSMEANPQKRSGACKQCQWKASSGGPLLLAMQVDAGYPGCKSIDSPKACWCWRAILRSDAPLKSFLPWGLFFCCCQLELQIALPQLSHLLFTQPANLQLAEKLNRSRKHVDFPQSHHTARLKLLASQTWPWQLCSP